MFSVIDDLADRVIVPPRVRVWSRGEWHLYFDPYNFAWVRVNDSGRLLLELFCKHKTIGEAAEYISTQHKIAPEKAEALTRTFVDKLTASGFLHKGEYQERPRFVFPKFKFPLMVYLHMTNRCNLKCPYCYNKEDRHAKLKLEHKGQLYPELTTAEFKTLIGRILDCGAKQLFFTGGEPLMRTDTMELVEFARGRGRHLFLEMLTNATKITEEIAERICKTLDVVTISLDGHCRELHEFYRGKNTFEPTIRGIKMLVRKRAELRQATPRICTVPVITQKSVSSLTDIFKFSLEDLGIDVLSPIIFQAGDNQELSLGQIPSLDSYSKETNRLGQYLKERAAASACPQFSPTAVVPRSHCGAGFGELSIDPSGYIYPCQSLHFPEFLCGTIREKDIKDIYTESPVLQKLRSITGASLDVCSHCDLLYVCNGGCRASAYNVYRQADAYNEIYCKHLETLSVNRMFGGTEMEASCSPR